MYDLEPSSPTRDAPHPFDQHSADVTLRTSDSVHFHVHTQILSQVSPFFATMFGLPQQSSEPKVPLVRPVIDVTENSKALDPLLRLCYPICKPELHHLDEIQPALEAAIKYDMERPTAVLTARLIACAAQSPLQVWAFGCRHGLERVARGGAEALWASLPRGARERLSFLPDIPPSVQGLDGISAGQYFRLLQFVRCGGGRRDDGAAAGRVCSPNAVGTGDTGTLAEATHVSDGIALIRPPEVATTPVTTRAIARRRVFIYLSVADREGFPSLGHPSVEMHSSDIVCRCKDGTEFEAHQQILSLHSPVLKAQIATLNDSQPSQLEGPSDQAEEPTAALPVLHREGWSDAIFTLLCICYQVQHGPHWSELPCSRFDCIELLAVATKYQVQPAVDLAAARWQALAHLHPPNPGIRGVPMLRTAVAAATPAALGWCPPLRTRLDEYSRILEELPARTYHELFVYLDACARAAVQALESAMKAWELVEAQRTRTAAGQPEPVSEAAARMYQAVTDGLNRRREAVERCEVSPKADHMRALRWSSYSGVTGPPSFRNKFKENLESMLASLPREIDDAISKVKLDLG